jgi:putative ABC transport system permease protein
VRLLSFLVPRRLRATWSEEWRGELLARYGRGDGSPADSIASGRVAPDRHTATAPLRDASGAFRDALWHLKQEWNHDMLRHDLSFAVRLLARRPAFTAAVVITLALGIAANAAIYSLVDAIVLNPFVFPEPDRIVGLGTEYPRLGQELGFFENLSAAEYLDVLDGTETLEHVVAWDMGNRQITGGDRPENLFTAFWWGDVLPTLGMAPHLGRGFSREDIEERRPVAMISHRVWRARFAAEEAVIGSTIRVDGNPYTLIGVLPPGVLIYGTDLWLPMWVAPEELPRNRRQFQILARLKPGVSIEQANAELASIADRTELEYGAEFEEYRDWSLTALTWTEVNVRTLRPAGLILMGAVGFVLLLVCANVASLLLSRSAGRRKEMALRAALGAGRGRIARQVLTESILLAFVGGALGVALAHFGLDLIVSRLPAMLVPTDTGIQINGRVLWYSAGLSVFAGLIFGLAPATQASKINLQGTLSLESGHATGSKIRRRWHSFFVAVEVALALVMLVGAGLLIHSFVRFQRVDPGLDTSNTITMRLTLPWNKYEGEGITNFFTELADRVEALPGVRSAASGSQFAPISFIRQQFSLPGQEIEDEGTLPTAFVTIVSEGYFDALGIPLVAGRDFTSQDRPGSPFVAVVNNEMARRYFGEENPLGKRFKMGTPEADDPWFEIVGVVGDTKNRGLQNPTAPEYYVSLRQANGVFNQLFLLVRTDGDPRTILGSVREVVGSIDPEQPIYSIATLEETFAAGFAAQRSAMQLLAGFAAFALLLAAVGIYGVVSYAVSERTAEIGVRIALGAGQAAVRRLVVRQALVPVAIGAAVGLIMSVGLGVAISGLLFDVGSVDPVTLLGVVVLLFSIALGASYLPARRASRIDPLAALRAS